MKKLSTDTLIKNSLNYLKLSLKPDFFNDVCQLVIRESLLLTQWNFARRVEKCKLKYIAGTNIPDLCYIDTPAQPFYLLRTIEGNSISKRSLIFIDNRIYIVGTTSSEANNEIMISYYSLDSLIPVPSAFELLVQHKLTAYMALSYINNSTIANWYEVKSQTILDKIKSTFSDEI